MLIAPLLGDVAVPDALLDVRADIDAPGAVSAGGTPLSDATAFAQWNAAFRLVERGAATTLFTAATLGPQGRVSAYLTAPSPPAQDEVDAAQRTSPEADDLLRWLRAQGGKPASDLVS